MILAVLLAASLALVLGCWLGSLGEAMAVDDLGFVVSEFERVSNDLEDAYSQVERLEAEKVDALDQLAAKTAEAKAVKAIQTVDGPTYNHTRGDSYRTPCPECEKDSKHRAIRAQLRAAHVSPPGEASGRAMVAMVDFLDATTCGQ